ncbi:MAG: CRISPR-associated helicase Cas3' [Clostridiales bacterium]|nr:CRISPR-associated helicase Cas3' [Clostridiales bacterium]
MTNINFGGDNINTKFNYPAHIRIDGGQSTIQTVTEHSLNVSERCRAIIKRIHLENTGKLSGLIHDIGKNTHEFAEYITRAVSGEKVKRGSVIHTFQACRMMFDTFHKDSVESYDDLYNNLTCELLAIAAAAHHGQFDVIDYRGDDGIKYRNKADVAYKEAANNFFELCISRDELGRLFQKSVDEVKNIEMRMEASSINDDTCNFYLSMLYRILLSALIEADRSDTAQFMAGIDTPEPEDMHPIWNEKLRSLEDKLSTFSTEGAVNAARRKISEAAASFADMPCGIYRLNVPTGGGKTLTSLRAALAHAAAHNKQRIIFAIPLLSILDQNAAAIRNALDIYSNDDDFLLEHHSNVVRTNESEELDRNELVLENWHAPVIVTTLVQLLNSLFEGKTTSIRRMNALIDSVLIIDEVQSVPRKMLSLFNNAINFLAEFCGCTIILCSATQPCFDKTEHPMREAADIIPYDAELWKAFKRTELVDMTDKPMDGDSIAEFALDKLYDAGSVLIICNKKTEAVELYDRLCGSEANVYHLSTSMCMSHRKKVVAEISNGLSNKLPVICVSTQVMEAGVDLSFGCVIRVRAGLDNLIQAAGRCNRNGESSEMLPVYCIDWENEKLGRLTDIESSKKVMCELLNAYRKNKIDSLQSEAAVHFYYEKLFVSAMDEEYDYKIEQYSSTVLSMLSANDEFVDKCTDDPEYYFNQAFKTAGDKFCVFDNNTLDILVPWGDGERLIEELGSARAKSDLKYRHELIRKSRLYTVAIYDYQRNKLEKAGALTSICDGATVVLKDGYYDDNIGLSKYRQHDFEYIEI